MISIIIIVKNDRNIQYTLSKLVEIKSPKKREIIVIDSSADNLSDLKSLFKNVKWITYASKISKKITIPEQRNLGLKEAKGNIIVFIDANCVPEKDWLINLTKPIYEDNETIVCGKTNSANANTIHDQFYKSVFNKKYLEECPTINLAFKKILLNNIGLFDELFEYGSDVDFTWRAVDAGFRIRYQNSAVISHNWGNSKEEIMRSYRYGSARARLYKKHIKRLPQLIAKDNHIIVYVLYILGLPLTFFYPWYPFILLLLFVKNIRNSPLYVLLDHLVYAAGFLTHLIKK